MTNSVSLPFSYVVLLYVDVFNIRASAITISVSNDLPHVGLVNFFFVTYSRTRL